MKIINKEMKSIEFKYIKKGECFLMDRNGGCLWMKGSNSEETVNIINLTDGSIGTLGHYVGVFPVNAHIVIN